MDVKKYRKILSGTLASLTFLLHSPLELLAAEPINNIQIYQNSEIPQLNEAGQLNHHRRSGRYRRGRLIGFENLNSLREDNSPVSVIVLLHEKPLVVQRASLENSTSSSNISPAFTIETERSLFHQELSELSSSILHGQGTRSTQTSPIYITQEFRHAFNGVVLTLPSNAVEELANFRSVSMVFPNELIQVNPILTPMGSDYELIDIFSSNAEGVRQGRERMNAHILHEQGYRGQGMLIAILDTGVYYHHPAFAGSFPTQADMAARGVSIPNNYLLYISGEGYVFAGRDYLALYNGGAFLNNTQRNDPMETSPARFPSSPPSVHGTHVSAIAVGRSENLIGIAPEAFGIHYRVLGPTGATIPDVIAAMEHASIHMRADVVNLSLGPNAFSPLIDPIHIAVNNLSIATDSIFVFAAGNSGSNYSTAWGGGNSSFGINVANFAEPSGTLPLRVALTSSRGPSNLSNEITPEIGAIGTNVLSAVPPWAGVGSYFAATGTSTSSPMVAGGIALMLQRSLSYGSPWERSEIRARLMNSAIPVSNSQNLSGFSTFAGVFETGAGQVDLLAAINQDVLVNVYFNAFLTSPTDRMLVQTGAFSFGGLNTYLLSQGIVTSVSSSLRATIRNTSSEDKTFTFRYVPITNARNSIASEHTIQLPQSLTVLSGGQENFEASIIVTGDSLGHHEGFIEVLSGNEVIARLPYAAVTYYTEVEHLVYPPSYNFHRLQVQVDGLETEFPGRVSLFEIYQLGKTLSVHPIIPNDWRISTNNLFYPINLIDDAEFYYFDFWLADPFNILPPGTTIDNYGIVDFAGGMPGLGSFAVHSENISENYHETAVIYITSGVEEVRVTPANHEMHYADGSDARNTQTFRASAFARDRDGEEIEITFIEYWNWGADTYYISSDPASLYYNPLNPVNAYSEVNITQGASPHYGVVHWAGSAGWEAGHRFNVWAYYELENDRRSANLIFFNYFIQPTRSFIEYVQSLERTTVEDPINPGIIFSNFFGFSFIDGTNFIPRDHQNNLASSYEFRHPGRLLGSVSFNLEYTTPYILISVYNLPPYTSIRGVSAMDGIVVSSPLGTPTTFRVAVQMN
ncbi:MAG: S8 family serine peptidase [Defluviitaleaceae bacterium]|nr:S8 family serine peptidase [Defluviitaleaceae bacterium]